MCCKEGQELGSEMHEEHTPLRAPFFDAVLERVVLGAHDEENKERRCTTTAGKS